MTTLQAPKDVTKISVEQQEFTISDNGTVTVPDNFVEQLRDIGFRIVPARIVVSKEAADAIAQAAANLGLPTPPVSVVDTPETRAAAAAKVAALAAAANVPPVGQERINGSPLAVVEAAAIADPAERAAALAKLAADAKPKIDF